MNLKIIYIIYLVTSIALTAQINKVNVSIKVFSEKAAKIYITGNNEQFGNWQPDQIPLERKNDHWAKTFSFDENTGLEFKFTKGSWESEALNEKGNIPGNFSLKAAKDTTLTFIINSWNDGNAQIAFQGQITGRVIYHKQMTFNGLLPRDIIVWLPPGYKENEGKRYPVLYMHDGQNLFDPKTSFTNIDWQLDEAADSLIAQNKIKPMIIVGIYNTEHRTAEYTPSKTNELYKKFVIDKLKPFIDNTYKTLSGREYTYTGGSSFGGTISFMFLWEHSNIFSKAACFSPAFVTQHFNYIKGMKELESSNNIQLYLDNGGIGLEAQLQNGVNLMVEKLTLFGYKKEKDYALIIDKNAEHNEAAWAKRVPQMLKILFGK